MPGHHEGSQTCSTKDSPPSTGCCLPRSASPFHRSSHSCPTLVYVRLLPPASCGYNGEHGPSGDGCRRHGDECGGNEATCLCAASTAFSRVDLVLAFYRQGKFHLVDGLIPSGKRKHFNYLHSSLRQRH